MGDAAKTSPLAELRDVHKRYEALEAVEAPEILAGVDLRVEQGESIAILGPSGSGKSTLLYILGGLLEATSGEVLFDGVDMSRLDADARAALRNREIGFVFQSHHLLPQCTALENVLIPSLVDRDAAHRAAAPERARALLETVGLGARLAHRPSQLSGGECQRVAVVRALINEPRLLLADEPTGSLDGKAAEEIGRILVELNERDSVAIVTVTHSPQLASRMKRVCEMRDGKIASAATHA